MMVTGLPNVELQVSRVRVEGLRRTKTDIVVEQIKDVFDVRNLVELATKAEAAADKLREMDLFKFVDVILDTAKPREGGRGTEGGVEVTFVVKEGGRFKGSFGGHGGTQSAGVHGSIALRNLFGRAERLEWNSNISYPLWGKNTQIQFSKPYYKDLSKILSLSLGTTDNSAPFSGYQEWITGASVALSFISRLGNHHLSLGYNDRQLYGFPHTVPMAIREEAGHSIKSSVQHVLEWDERDNPLFPRNGARLKMTNEVAGFGGDILFSKMDLLSECYLQLYQNWVVAVSLWGGYLHPFTPSKINDRFFLGGPSTLRGFGMWGAGPRENGYSLGGEAYWASGVHLYAPVPLLPRNGLFSRCRLHGFATTGNILRTGLGAPTLRSIASNLRLSCGAGLHVRLGLAQIEINYAIPIKAHPGDRLEPGLQFGMGVDML